MLCSKLHCQKGFDLNPFHVRLLWIPGPYVSNPLGAYGFPTEVNRWSVKAESNLAANEPVLNLRTTSSQKCEAVPRRARV